MQDHDLLTILSDLRKVRAELDVLRGELWGKKRVGSLPVDSELKSVTSIRKAVDVVVEELETAIEGDA